MPQNLSSSLTIREAGIEDLADLVVLACKPGLAEVRKHPARIVKPVLKTRIQDRCLLMASWKGQPRGIAGYDPERGEISELLVSEGISKIAIAAELLDRIERLAVSFGAVELEVVLDPASHKRLFIDNYTERFSSSGGRQTREGRPVRILGRSLLRRQTQFSRNISQLCEELGIPSNYGRSHRLQLQKEASSLKSIGKDVFGRNQRMTPAAAAAWRRLQKAASKDGIELQAVSAWRSVDYQLDLLKSKVESGQSMEEILAVSAAPGYSEHHSGKAIDITTPGFKALEEEFENSPAFEWLNSHAPAIGFRLSFPSNNRHKMCYEPWHWYYCR